MGIATFLTSLRACPPCSTLSFAGSGIFARMARPLDAVVVDEAAQAVEPSSLIPMTLGIKQVGEAGS